MTASSRQVGVALCTWKQVSGWSAVHARYGIFFFFFKEWKTHLRWEAVLPGMARSAVNRRGRLCFQADCELVQTNTLNTNYGIVGCFKSDGSWRQVSSARVCVCVWDTGSVRFMGRLSVFHHALISAWQTSIHTHTKQILIFRLSLSLLFVFRRKWKQPLVVLAASWSHAVADVKGWHGPSPEHIEGLVRGAFPRSRWGHASPSQPLVTAEGWRSA